LDYLAFEFGFRPGANPPSDFVFPEVPEKHLPEIKLEDNTQNVPRAASCDRLHILSLSFLNTKG
jgi:hypothetical protein